MCCKGRFTKLFAVLTLSIVALSFIFQGHREVISPERAHFVPECKYVNSHYYLGSECISSSDEQISNPMEKIFQIIFILFFISPPIIAFLLFLIWRELKERNKMK